MQRMYTIKLGHFPYFYLKEISLNLRVFMEKLFFLDKIKNSPKISKIPPKNDKKGLQKNGIFFCIFGIIFVILRGIFVLFGGFMYYLRSYLYFLGRFKYDPFYPSIRFFLKKVGIKI